MVISDLKYLSDKFGNWANVYNPPMANMELTGDSNINVCSIFLGECDVLHRFNF